MTPRERQLAVATGAVLALWGLVALCQPLMERWSALGEEEAGLAEALQREQELRDRLPALSESWKGLEAELQPDGPASALVPGFAAFVRELSREAGFEPTSFRYVGARSLDQEAKAAGLTRSPWAELRFELKARTRLERLEGFCVQLAAASRPVRITSLGITPREGDDLEADLTLVALVPSRALEEAR